MNTLNHARFARRKRDESDKLNVLIQAKVKGSIFLSEFSDGMVEASEDL